MLGTSTQTMGFHGFQSQEEPLEENSDDEFHDSMTQLELEGTKVPDVEIALESNKQSKKTLDRELRSLESSNLPGKKA